MVSNEHLVSLEIICVTINTLACRLSGLCDVSVLGNSLSVTDVDIIKLWGITKLGKANEKKNLKTGNNREAGLRSGIAQVEGFTWDRMPALKSWL